jgi:DNA mismatch repair protein MutS
MGWWSGTGLLRDLREAAQGVPDLDRALSRLALTAGAAGSRRDPRRAGGRRGGVAGLLGAEELPELLAEALESLAGPEGLLALLEEALVAQPPTLARDGGFVAAGFAPDLDAARRLRDEGRAVIAGMQAEYARATGIAGLKIRHNGTLGYVVEVTTAQAERLRKAPFDTVFHHRQSTASAARFVTGELSETEARLLNAAEEALGIERRIYGELRGAVLTKAAALARVAGALAEVDVAAALADLAAQDGWVRPVLEDGRAFELKAGRHPVVEAALRRGGKPFVANDCDLNERPFRLVTGPNMGGKSTYLRQAGLLAVLAQAGSFVPAERFRLGLVSRLFSRVGASDDLSRGRSTFMVEMVETAAILHGADEHSLVLLDEIGRGTATWDGLSIAWAVLEHLEGGLPGALRARITTSWPPGGPAARGGERPCGGDGLERGARVPARGAGGGGGPELWRAGGAARGVAGKVVARAKAVLRALRRGRARGARGPSRTSCRCSRSGAAPEPEPSAVEERLRRVKPTS